MKKVIRLTESDLTKLVKRIIQEEESDPFGYQSKFDDYKLGHGDDLETYKSKVSKRDSDEDYRLFKLKKMLTSSMLAAKTEEELMDAILNVADMAKYRKTKPFN